LTKNSLGDPRALPGALVVSLWIASSSLFECAAAAPGVAPPAPSMTVGSTSASVRRPDAVPLESTGALPVPRAHAEARGVVSLVEPAPDAAVADLLRSFVDAWRSESIDALAALLTADAGPLDARSHGRTVLVEGWRARLRAHPYARLEGTEVLRSDRIERWSDGELGAAGSPARPSDMQPGEFLVRAPLEVIRIGNEKVFGDVIEMVLRAEDGKLRIAAYGEMDAP
jgi:hypothetical protein